MADFNGLPMSGPGEQGFDAAHLGKIDTTMAAAVERRHVPGVVTVVARHGKVVHAGAVGSPVSYTHLTLPTKAEV